MTASERERAFVRLFEENRARLLRFCAGFLGSTADAEDLLQVILVNVWNGLPAFRGDAAETTWVYRIAVNTALMHRRKHEREARATTPLAGVPEPAAPMAVAEDERLARLRGAIATLGVQDRLCITLLLDDLTYKEIAEVTGMTVNHVGVRISRARKRLEALMKEGRVGPA
jgi:RNA polymerase sigma-70 factor (ECF subfamily)